jgi:hypothetical protein
MNAKNVIVKMRLKKEGTIVMQLTGRCMEPLLIAGDSVKITPASQYESGYLYLFELLDGSLAVHRLVGKTEDSVLMKGDRSRGFETIPYTNILGVVSEVKLCNRAHWINIFKYKRSVAIITYMSKKRMKDKNLEHNDLTSGFYAPFLIGFSYVLRTWWEMYH